MTVNISRIPPDPPQPVYRIEIDEETAWAIRDALGSCALGGDNPLDTFWDALSNALSTTPFGDDRPRGLKKWRLEVDAKRPHPVLRADE
jgi:hypothetical protein